MRILDKTFLTEDEHWDVPGAISDQVERQLKSLKIDSYNNRYVIRLTVDIVDDSLSELPDDDEE